MFVKKTILSCTVICFICTGLSAQTPLDFELYGDTSKPEIATNILPEIKINKKPDFNLNAGTSFTYLGKYGSFSNVYLSPSWSYQLTKRFSIRAGTIINYTPFSSLPGLNLQNEQVQTNNHRVGLMVYTEGAYLATSRLTISGAAYKELTPSYKPYLNPYYNNYKMQGASVGVSYKLFKNVHIGAMFQYSNTPGIYDNNRLNNPWYDPFYW